MKRTNRSPFVIVLVVALTACAAFPVAAHAARLATAPEAKALRKAFFRNRHHRHLVITSMEVAKSNRTWARVRFTRPFGRSKQDLAAAASSSALRAKPKILYLNYRQSGPRSHPHAKPTKAKPPRKVRRDLDKDVWLRVTYQGHATEHAKATYNRSGSCGPGQDYTENLTWTANDHWDWHVTKMLDVSKSQPDVAFAYGTIHTDVISYRSPAVAPTYGDGTESISYRDDYTGPGADACNSDTDFTATARGHLSASSYFAKYPIKSVPGVGLSLLIPSVLGPRTTSDGDSHEGELSGVGNPRFISSIDPGVSYVGIPFLDYHNPNTYDYRGESPYKFTFSRNSLGGPQGGQTVSQDGYCAEARGQCSDTVDYSGTVTVEPK